MLISFLGNVNEEWQAFLSDAGLIILALVYLGVIITLLIENRDPVKSLAYIMIFILLPGIGLIVYFFIGRDQRKRRKFTLKGSGDLLRIREFIDFYKSYFLHIHQLLEREYPENANIADLFLHTRQSILTDKNAVKVLCNGEEKYELLLEDLENAKHHIHLEYYIFNHDETGIAITNKLIKKIGEGVKVRFIYDDFGSGAIGDVPDLLENAGAEVIVFDPMRVNLYTNANYRNHRKIVVIDGAISYVGGINIANGYDNRQNNYVYWRDTHLRIEGNATNMLQMQFLLSYKYATGGDIFPFEYPYFHFDQDPSTAYIDIVGSGPDSPDPYNMLGVIAAINKTRDIIQIANPYFIPNAQVSTALEIAAQSGKTVRLMVPEKADSKFVQWAMDSYMKSMLRAGVEVYRYKKGFIHAKTLTVDDSMSMVGTVNLDSRSFYINFEIAAYIYDRDVTRRLRDMFEDDMSDCVKLVLSEWEKRPVVHKFMESLCRLLTPLL